MSEEELVVKSYERGTIISHAHSWKQELNCLCVLAANMKNPTLRWWDRGRGWTSSGLGVGVSGSLQHKWAAQTKGKGKRKDCCLIKQEENSPRRPSSQERRFLSRRHSEQNTSSLQMGRGRGGVCILWTSDQHYNAVGKSNRPCGDQRRPCGMFPFRQAFNPHHKIWCT